METCDKFLKHAIALPVISVHRRGIGDTVAANVSERADYHICSLLSLFVASAVSRVDFIFWSLLLWFEETKQGRVHLYL